jgi:hypothetical protein
MLCEIGFFDECVRPERFHQLRLRQHPIGIARQKKQQVERLRGQWNRLARELEPAEREVYPELAEYVELPVSQWLDRVERLLILY